MIKRAMPGGKSRKAKKARGRSASKKSAKARSVHFVALDHTDVDGAYEAIMRMVAEADGRKKK